MKVCTQTSGFLYTSKEVEDAINRFGSCKPWLSGGVTPATEIQLRNRRKGLHENIQYL